MYKDIVAMLINGPEFIVFFNRDPIYFLNIWGPENLFGTRRYSKSVCRYVYGYIVQIIIDKKRVL